MEIISAAVPSSYSGVVPSRARGATRGSLRKAARRAMLSIVALAAVIGLPVSGFLYSLGAHYHEHDSSHDGVAQQALMPRVPIVIGTGTEDGGGTLVLRSSPALDDVTPGGADEREP